MRTVALALLALSTVTTAASAQDTTFRGFRIEGNAGYDWFKVNGAPQRGKFGFGGSGGFDGQIGDKIVIGPEVNYWQPSHEDNTVGFVNNAGNTAFRRSRYILGSAVRVGYLVTPDLLVFGKGGYANNAQYRTLYNPAGAFVRQDRFRTDGYQYGGGIEYTLHDKFSFAPTGLYVSAQYVRDEFGNRHSSDQHAMGGVGLRFR
jgi:outer membrane immunogenic protein